MNWVGGSRSRHLLKGEAKRQKEFFEKRKLQQKLKNLGLPLPNSSETCPSGSMDLVTLFIVNQIATKKEQKDPPKVTVLSDGTRAGSKQRRNEPLVLPMSPCSPSQLSLVESQAHEHSLTRKRKHLSKLSPVPESAFSDNSASDYVPHAAEALSPFSTLSSSSAPGRGIFPLQLNQQQSGESQAEVSIYCSQAWGGPQPEHALTFSQNPRPRSSATDLIRLETPSAAQVLFGSPSPLDLSDDKVPALDFSLNRPEYEEHFEEDVFRGFSSGEFMEESVTSKIHLGSDRLFQPLKPQMVPETLCSELPSWANTSFSCGGNSSAILDEGQYSPRCFTSDSSEDEEECCAQFCLKTSSSTESNRRPLGPLLHPFPPLKPRLKIREEVTTGPNELNPDSNQQSGGQSTPGFLRSLAPAQCQCWRKHTQTQETQETHETRERGTQTEHSGDTREAEVQCSLMPETRAPGLDLYQPQVESTVQLLSTRGQTLHTDVRKRDAPIHSPGLSGKEEGYWSRMMLRANPQSEAFRSSGDGLFTENKSEPSGDRWRQTAEDKVKEDAQTQGIADILLLLKQGTNTSSKHMQ